MKNRGRVLVMTAAVLIGIALWLPGLPSRRVAAQSPSPTGSYAFMATVPYSGPQTGQSTLAGPVAIVGVMTFDGAGNVTGSQTLVRQDQSLTATDPRVQTQTFTGTYIVNADGTGTITVPGGGTNTFVLTDGGAGAMFVLSAGGNYVLTGTARKQ